ncbi:MAG: hypothetical protein NC301_08840 [Bacteroides sp.]|nr:hypothetical protein [Bacteroides sp.]
MKQEWKPEEIRQTAEEIRAAIMPKSITPEMVGGTLLALTNAVGEVVETLGEIPREHVKVRVRGYDGHGAVSGAGATVWLDVFACGGFPCVAIPRQELTADEKGTVEFDVPHGFKYAVSSHIGGLGASFQLVFDAAAEARNVNLWNFPVGVWALGHTDVALYADEDAGRPEDIYRAIPFITDRFSDDPSGNYEDVVGWDINEEEGECSEGSWYVGILVSTADTSFAIGQYKSKSGESMPWCRSRAYDTLIPLMDYYAIDRNDGTWNWNESVEKARMDMDGHMNTVKILAYDPSHTAAAWCADSESDYDERRFLPSAGQLLIMALNASAINALMQQAIDDLGWNGFDLLPYKNEKDQWVCPSGDSWWWSSSVLDKICSWVAYYNGYIYTNYSGNTNDVRAVSAFHFEY